MILFAADHHYGAHCGRTLYEALGKPASIAFFENDWSCFETDLSARYSLLMLNLITDTCEVPPPSEAGAAQVRHYLEQGGSLLLLHGASAAFWPWEWWRPQVGYRWVRGNDPDGVAPSTHPKRPFKVDIAKSRHPLCAKLQPLDLPQDEIYTNLEQTRPCITLMETTTDEGTFPQCYETRTDWGGRVLGYLPGHAPEVVSHPAMVANCRILIQDLLDKQAVV